VRCVVKWLRQDESGAVAVVVALLIVSFISLSALVVDMGYLYSVRRQLQAAADAAALAGCQALIEEKSEPEVLAVAEAYAQSNGVKPADGLVMDTQPPNTEITADHVKVTVRKTAPLFFARILGRGTQMVAAQAIAKVAYVSGIKGLMPWAAPIIRANRVTAKIGSGPEVPLTLNGDTGRWEGDVTASLPMSHQGYEVRVTAYNNQTQYPDGTSDYPNGVPEVLSWADSLVTHEASCAIRNVFLNKNFVVSGQDTSVELFVEKSADSSIAGSPSARFNGKNYNLSIVSGEPNRYSVSLPVPATSDLVVSLPIDVSVGQGASAVSITNAAVLVVRRSTYPIRQVTTQERFFSGGYGGQTHVSVELNSYVYGREYELKVVAGAEVGSFCALDLSTIKHPPNWRHPQDPSEYELSSAASEYYNYIANYFPFAVHIGDTIWTQTGNLSAPQTDNSLETRFDGNEMSFSDWEAAGKPAGSSRLIYVPVMEKMQNVSGQTPLRVVALAAFYVEPEVETKGGSVAIRGRFVQYIAPSEGVSEEPMGDYYIETPHLISEGLDY